MTSHPDPTAFRVLHTLHLEADQTWQGHLARGTFIHVLAGELRLLPPMQASDATVWRAPVTLGEGQAHALAQGGWVQVRALGEVRWVCFVREAGWRAALRAWWVQRRGRARQMA